MDEETDKILESLLAYELESGIDEKAILLEVLAKYSDHSKWNDAEFEHIKRISNTHVGGVGQDFVERLCTELGFTCEFPTKETGGRSTNSPWDIRINGVTFEVKTATEDVNGTFQFNHVRYHRPYQALLCIGITPNDIFFDAWSKADVTTGKAGNLTSMEKGANASYKLSKKPAALKHINEFEEPMLHLIGTIT